MNPKLVKYFVPVTDSVSLILFLCHPLLPPGRVLVVVQTLAVSPWRRRQEQM